MSEGPDPMTDRLSRFTPTAGGLDRDALLFAAGRRSARGSRLWPVLAGLLLVSQAVTLCVLWPAELPAPVTAPAPVVPDAPVPIERGPPPVSPPPDVWSVSTSPDLIQSA